MPETKYLYLKQYSFPEEEYLSLQKNIDPAMKCLFLIQNIYRCKIVFISGKKHLDLQQNI